MGEDVKSLLDRVCGMAAERLDADRLDTSKRRHRDMLAGRPTDYIPITLNKPLPELAELPVFNWARQFHDPAVSLYMQMIDFVLPQVNGGGDCCPAVRADTGVINSMSVFGAEYTVPEHTKPVISEYVPKDKLVAFEPPEDISGVGVMPRMIEHMEHHIDALRERGLGDLIAVTHCDQQGPFDIAAQTRGHDFFIDLYEDPDFAHSLMSKTTAVYIAVSKLCKRLNGDPLDGGNAVGIFSETGGVRMCGDSDILVRTDLFDAFIRPYEEQAFEAFGGGWFHYCGGEAGTGRREGLHLHDSYAQITGLRGLNWTTARDWLAEMRELNRRGIVHIGGAARNGQSLREYFKSVLNTCDRRWGMIFQADVRPEETDEAADTWHELQDALFD